MIFTADMCLLMCNNVGHILLIHIERQIDFRVHDSKYKRRNYILTLENIITEQYRSTDFSLYPEITDCSIQEISCSVNTFFPSRRIIF